MHLLYHLRFGISGIGDGDDHIALYSV